MLKVLHSPLCAAWATQHVWLYVIRHYITAVKEITDENVSLTKFLFNVFLFPLYNNIYHLSLRFCLHWCSDIGCICFSDQWGSYRVCICTCLPCDDLCTCWLHGSTICLDSGLGDQAYSVKQWYQWEAEEFSQYFIIWSTQGSIDSETKSNLVDRCWQKYKTDDVHIEMEPKMPPTCQHPGTLNFIF